MARLIVLAVLGAWVGCTQSYTGAIRQVGPGVCYAYLFPLVMAPKLPPSGWGAP